MASFEKKLITTLVGTAILATSANPALAVTLNIETMPDGGEKIIKEVVDSGLMSVYSDGKFRPNEVMQRQKLARFVDAALKYRKASLAGYYTTKDYSTLLTDVPSSDFYFPFIASMYDKGVIKGYADKTFKGSQTVTRGEALAMLVRAYGLIKDTEIPNYAADPSLLTTKHRFSDVPSTNGFYNVIYHALENGWIKDFKNYRVSDNITKYEIAVLLHRILLENGTAKKDTTTTTTTTPKSVFYKGAQATLSNAKVEAPQANIVKLIVTTAPAMGDLIPNIDKNKLTVKINDVVIPASAISKITLISKNGKDVAYGIVLADPNAIKANSTIEVAYTDDHAKLEAVKTTIATITPTTPTNPTTNATGALTFALSSNNAAKFVPKNATNVEMLNLDVDAAADSTVRQITVSRQGLGNASDIKAIKLFINGVQAGSERTFNYSSNSATFYIPGDMQLIKAGKNNITIKADFAGVSGSYSKVVLNAIGDVNSGGTVGGSFPLVGGEVQTAGVDAGTVNFTNYAGAGGTYYIWDQNKEFGKFDLAATSTESVLVKSIRMRAMGTAKVTDVGNLKLFTNDGKEVSTTAVITSDGYAHFDLTKVGNDGGLIIERGEMKSFFVKGDVITGRSDSTIGFEIESGSDVNAEGRNYKFGVPVNKTSGSVSVVPFAIKGGKLSAALATTKIRDVAPRTNNVELGTFNFTTQGDSVRLKGLKFAVTATDKHATYPNATASEIARTSNLESIKVTVGENTFVYGPFDIPQPSTDVVYTKASHGIDGTNRAPANLQNNGIDTRIISIDDYIELPANKTTPIKITATFNGNMGKGDQYNASLILTRQDGSLVFTGENQWTRETMKNTDVTPSGSNSVITGNQITVNTANLTASLSPLPGSKSVARNAKDVELYGFTLSTGNAGDVKLRSIKVSRDTDMPLSSINDIESLKLYANGQLVSGVSGKSLVSGSPDYVLFDNLTSGTGSSNPLTLSGGQQMSFVVKADISANATIGNTGRFFIKDLNDFDIVDANGNSLNSNQKSFGDSAINSDSNTQAPIYTIQQGGVTVSLDNSTPVAGQVTAGDVDQRVFSFRVSAKNEDLYIRTLRLKVNGAAGNVYKLSLDRNGSAVAGGAKNVIAGVATWNLSGSERIKIAAGTDAIINVKAEVMTSDNSIAQSGQAFSIGFDSNTPIVVESEAGASSQVIGFKGTTTKDAGALLENVVANQNKIKTAAAHTAWVAGDILKVNNEEMLIIQKIADNEFSVIRGVNGTTPTSHLQNAAITSFDGTRVAEVKGEEFTVFYTRPVSITAENLPTTVLQVGQEQVLGAFTIKASDNKDATVNKLAVKNLRVKVAGNVHVTAVKLYNKQDSSVSVDGVITDAGKTITFDLSNMPAGKNEINENQSQTFEIKGLVNFVPAGGSLSLNINDLVGSSIADSDFVWSDGVGNYATVKANVDAVNGRVMTSNSNNDAGTRVY